MAKFSHTMKQILETISTLF